VLRSPWLSKELPTDFLPGLPTYDKSRWARLRLLALCSHRRAQSGAVLHELGRGWVEQRPSARRSPEAMKAVFLDEAQTKFVGAADREVVAEMT
jgi:hypothetical protein